MFFFLLKLVLLMLILATGYSAVRLIGSVNRATTTVQCVAGVASLPDLLLQSFVARINIQSTVFDR